MSLRRALRVWAVGGAAIGAPLARAHAPSSLTFCAGGHNLPMSQDGQPAGFEVEIARSLATTLHVEPGFEWLEPHTESLEEAVLQGRCDVALGAITDPGPMAGERRLPGVAYTSPYYQAGYLLLRRSGAPPRRALDDLGASRVGVEKESIVAFTLRQRRHPVHVMPTAAAVVNAMPEGRVDYGYLWGPLAAWLVRDRSDVLLEPGFISPDRWDFTLAVRERDRALNQRLNRAIAARKADGTVARIFRGYGMAYSSEVDSSGARIVARPRHGAAASPLERTVGTPRSREE